MRPGVFFPNILSRHVNATFEAYCEQKCERSYNPKRFSSSSLMIFNAFTRA